MKVELIAVKNEKGFINLALRMDGSIEPIAIKLNDFGGKEKARCIKLSYKLYCLANEGK